MVKSVLTIRASACQTYLPSRLASPTVWGPSSRVVSRALVMRDLPLGCSTCRCALIRDRIYMYIRTHKRTHMHIKACLPIYIHRSSVPTHMYMYIHIKTHMLCIYMCTHTHVHVPAPVLACLYQHIHVYAHVCMYN